MTSIQNGHPLPSPPVQQHDQYPQQYHPQQPQQPPYSPQQYQQRPAQRSRSKSSFSFRSDKSHKSNGSAGKVDLHETSREKQSRRLSTKADPRLAMSEAEPSVVASEVASKLAPLRAIQHRDAYGNPIADPDRSNPTRSRWERPLDTIRSFEAAIDGNYSRKSDMRSDSSDSVSALNRRSGYFGSNSGTTTPRFPQDAYYAGRGASNAGGRGNGGMSRPESYYDYNGGENGGPSNAYYPNRARYPRTASEPHLNNGVYPVNGNQQSYETVTTASGSGSSGEAPGYVTDPSSENSSVDRIAASGDSHGFGGPGVPRPQMQNYSNSYGGYPGSQSEMPTMYEAQNGPPAVPRKGNSGPPRVPIKLGSSGGGGPTEYEAPRPTNEKRKSWFGKRFSRS